ncbi:MAG: hypothetical protein ABI855_08005 [Bacteroidota bacterium]
MAFNTAPVTFKAAIAAFKTATAACKIETAVSRDATVIFNSAGEANHIETESFSHATAGGNEGIAAFILLIETDDSELSFVLISLKPYF